MEESINQVLCDHLNIPPQFSLCGHLRVRMQLTPTVCCVKVLSEVIVHTKKYPWTSLLSIFQAQVFGRI